MLQFRTRETKDFRGFPTATGNSVRHGCDKGSCRIDCDMLGFARPSDPAPDGAKISPSCRGAGPDLEPLGAIPTALEVPISADGFAGLQMNRGPQGERGQPEFVHFSEPLAAGNDLRR